MRRSIMALLAVIALAALSAPVLAGGWAVVHLDEEPGPVPAKTAWRFGFTVLQHDVTPNSDVAPLVRAIHKETGQAVMAAGQPEGAVGHFVAEIILPLAGDWKWSIRPEPFAATSFETLLVVDSTARLPKATPSAAPSGSGTTARVDIVEPFAFQPSALAIAPGTTVTWVNQTVASHTVTGDDLAFDDSGPLAPGESFSLTFDEPGTYRYHCAPHPDMVGRIVVT